MKLITLSVTALIGLALTSCNTARSIGDAAGGAVKATGGAVGNVANGAVNSTQNFAGAVASDVANAGNIVTGN